ncbi:MAG: hypothetical protein CL889_03450 [Dehalococcoidia bacterium]|nr:hypothetical protein [Dehalococcoidia bacterium]
MQSIKLRIGINHCLTGNNDLRYNGEPLSDGFVQDTLCKYANWIPVCLEIETDHIHQTLGCQSEHINDLSKKHLDGFILTSNSPRNDSFRPKVGLSKAGTSASNDMGVFARSLSLNYPALPIEENDRLYDPLIRENFLERIFTSKRWNIAFSNSFTPHALIQFHSSHKFLFMSHSVSLYQEMGRLVARSGLLTLAELKDRYVVLMSSSLKQMATPKKHANVMQHIMGFLKGLIDADEKKEIVETIDQYRTGQVPWIVPITLLNLHLRKNSVADWVLNQTYLNPYPAELMLRNIV